MSGGHFNYDQYKIDKIADQVEQLIRSNDDQTPDRFGDPVGRGFDDGVICQFQYGLKVLREAAIFAQRIDWLVSGDDSPESFLRRLGDDLGGVSNG